MQAHLITLFPEAWPGLLGQSLAGKALAAGVWGLHLHDLRAHGRGLHQQVDDSPFGGGRGMVMRADVVDAALKTHVPPGARVILPSPRGGLFNQAMAQEWAQQETLCFLCPRYEGVDQRVIDAWEMHEVSLGDFILAGGDSAAMVMLEAVLRLIPGIIGNDELHAEESFANNLLEYPHYTRPAEWNGQQVPDVLRGGNHADVTAWRLQQRQKITLARRPDLWLKYLLNRKKTPQ